MKIDSNLMRRFTPTGILLLLALGLRFYDLGKHALTSDELLYRADMSNTAVWLRQGEFRNHGVKPRHGTPHGLVGPTISFVAGRITWFFTRPWLPEGNEERDNALSRVGYALCGWGIVWLTFLFSRQLYSDAVALPLTAVAALSPMMIVWSRSEFLDVPMTFFLILSFYWLWVASQETRTRRRYAFLAAASLAAGTALGSKWTAFIVMPFIPSAYLGIRFLQLRKAWTWRETGEQAAFAAACFLCSLLWLTWDSYAWALSSDPRYSYGDMKIDSGGVWRHTVEILTRHDGVAQKIIFIAGPAAVVLAAGMLRAPEMIRRLTPRSALLLAMSLSAFLVFWITPTVLASWRAFYSMAAFTLVSGVLLERLPSRRLIWAAVAITLILLPFSVSDGLRRAKARVDYYGNDFLSGGPLPPIDEKHQIFKLSSHL